MSHQSVIYWAYRVLCTVSNHGFLKKHTYFDGYYFNMLNLSPLHTEMNACYKYIDIVLNSNTIKNSLILRLNSTAPGGIATRDAIVVYG